MHQALEAWLSLVASAAGLGAVRLSFVLAKHFGMQFTVSEQAWIRGHAQSCALLVEEWAAQQIAAGVTPTSKTKLEAACYKLCERTGISPDEAKEAIHAALPTLALGATQVAQTLETKVEAAK